MTLTDELRDERLEHDDRTGWRRVKANVAGMFDDERIKRCPWLILDEGRMSVALDMANKIRYVDESVWPVPQGERARAYLERCLRAAGRRRVAFVGCDGYDDDDKPTGSLDFLRTPPAYYYDAEVRDGCFAVIDINMAYWSLLKPGTLDMRFRPEFDRMAVNVGTIGFERADEVDKHLGRAIYGVMRSHTLSEYRYGKLKLNQGANRYLAPDAVGLMLWTMHAIANEAVREFDCAHVATDAFIVPADRGELLREWLAARWGLRSGIVAQGKGHLYRLNQWRIGHERRSMGLVAGRKPVDGPGISTLLELSEADCEELCDVRRRMCESVRAYM